MAVLAAGAVTGPNSPDHTVESTKYHVLGVLARALQAARNTLNSASRSAGEAAARAAGEPTGKEGSVHETLWEETARIRDLLLETEIECLHHIGPG